MRHNQSVLGTRQRAFETLNVRLDPKTNEDRLFPAGYPGVLRVNFPVSRPTYPKTNFDRPTKDKFLDRRRSPAVSHGHHSHPQASALFVSPDGHWHPLRRMRWGAPAVGAIIRCHA